MDTPLSIWYCDHCGKPISEARTGYIIWRSDGKKSHDFRIIHQNICDNKSFGASMHLSHFLGVDGMTRLLAFFSAGKLRADNAKDINRSAIDETDNFVDLIRRLQIPYYEEARRYFGCSEVWDDFYDAGEDTPYTPESLKRIIETGKNSSE